MRFLLGSNFWGMNTEESDKDYLEFVLPTKEELFYGKFKSIQFEDEYGNDISIKDIRLMLKELKKGSLKMFEAIYAPVADEDENIILDTILMFLNANADKLFEELRVEFMNSIIGESRRRIKSLENNFTGKELAHLQKLYWLLSTTYENRNPFHIVTLQPNKDKLKIIRLYPDESLFEVLKEKFELFYNMELEQPSDEKPVLRELEELMINLII